MTNIHGLGTALITPFTPQGNVDFPALESILSKQIESHSVDFIVVLGTTGEPATMTEDERLQVRQFVARYVRGRLPLVLGVGGNCTAQVCQFLSDNTEEIRRDYQAILSVCPFYNKPNQEGMFQHFSAIAEASPVPVMLYNVPGRTGVNLKPDTVLRLHNAFPEQIVAIKEASGRLDQIADLLSRAPETLSVFSGDDALACAVMARGGHGLISVASNALPVEMGRIVHDMDESLQQRLNNLFRQLFEEGNPSGIKTVLHQQGLISNTLRLPLVPCSRTLQRQISLSLAQI